MFTVLQTGNSVRCRARYSVDEAYGNMQDKYVRQENSLLKQFSLRGTLVTQGLI